MSISHCTSAPYLPSQSTSITSHPCRRNGSPTLPVPLQRKRALGMDPLFSQRFLSRALYECDGWRVCASFRNSMNCVPRRCNTGMNDPVQRLDHLLTTFEARPPCFFFCLNKNMGQVSSCVVGALAGCCFREVEVIVENHVREKVQAELALLREELTACSSCVTRPCRF